RGERVHVQAGNGCLDRPNDGQVVVAGERRMDSALEADLGCSALPGFPAAPHDLVVRYEVRRTAEVRGELPLRECAEAAAEVADVRVLDVARDDVADLVTAHFTPEAVCSGKHPVAFVAARAKETRDLFLPQ